MTNPPKPTIREKKYRMTEICPCCHKPLTTRITTEKQEYEEMMSERGLRTTPLCDDCQALLSPQTGEGEKPQERKPSGQECKHGYKNNLCLTCYHEPPQPSGQECGWCVYEKTKITDLCKKHQKQWVDERTEANHSIEYPQPPQPKQDWDKGVDGLELRTMQSEPPISMVVNRKELKSFISQAIQKAVEETKADIREKLQLNIDYILGGFPIGSLSDETKQRVYAFQDAIKLLDSPQHP